MNGPDPDQDKLAAVLDRLDAALGRIARAQREATRPAALNGEEPAWTADVAGRLDGLIGELRRALSGEPG